jgi:hypothetical protein
MDYLGYRLHSPSSGIEAAKMGQSLPQPFQDHLGLTNDNAFTPMQGMDEEGQGQFPHRHYSDLPGLNGDGLVAGYEIPKQQSSEANSVGFPSTPEHPADEFDANAAHLDTKGGYIGHGYLNPAHSTYGTNVNSTPGKASVDSALSIHFFNPIYSNAYNAHTDIIDPNLFPASQYSNEPSFVGLSSPAGPAQRFVEGLFPESAYNSFPSYCMAADGFEMRKVHSYDQTKPFDVPIKLELAWDGSYTGYDSESLAAPAMTGDFLPSSFAM